MNEYQELHLEELQAEGHNISYMEISFKMFHFYFLYSKQQ